ncbi:MAG: hypothetical protein KatS3mg077_2344 [Candidatus Binatia bacterium]|nr:MAG: hypothetical protein KatS3mg077_2344 [Candidatus Binatia bacterium]
MAARVREGPYARMASRSVHAFASIRVAVAFGLWQLECPNGRAHGSSSDERRSSRPSGGQSLARGRKKSFPGGSGFSSVAIAVLCALYALPLFWPPVARLPEWHADASWLARLFPDVPSWWVALRLLALWIAAGWFAWRYGSSPPALASASPPGSRPKRWQEGGAIGASAVVLLLSFWMHQGRSMASLLYVAALFVPGFLLARLPSSRARQAPDPSPGRMPPAAWAFSVVAAWVIVFLVMERGSLEATRAVDQWRAFVDALHFVNGEGNYLADRYDPELPNLSALPFVFQGLPSWQLGLASVSLASLQVHQMFWLAAAALGLATVVSKLFGPVPAAFAAAGFLWSPLTHLFAVSPAPYLFGPVMTVALLLLLERFYVRGSRCALANAGPLAGLALGYPSMAPLVAVAGVLFLRRLRATWRTHRAAWIAGGCGLVAALLPARVRVFSLEETGHLLSFHGNAAWLDLSLLGQSSLRLMEEARAVDIRRSADIALGALLAPFAHSRLHIRLWGDTILDPLTSVAFAFGCAVCLRFLRQSPLARVLVALWAGMILPSLVSPVDRVDIVHSVSFAVVVAVIAATGLAQIFQRLPQTARVPAGCAVLIFASVAGHVLQHRVNPRILASSATGLALESVAAEDVPRVVVLDYPSGFHPDVRWLYVGPMTAFARNVPVGYLRLESGTVPVPQLIADGKELVFWSPGLDQDLLVTDHICRHWPAAELFVIFDPAHLGQVRVARLAGAQWIPKLSRERWQVTLCPAGS